ncbi:hypothetical protein PoB_004821300 [Plakobranchus ocellatus]|uniref:Uncharacterized protein n=1 Tax=Plakobranchus ocellatus TaxID=259542 RepID=A0AAV4BRE9_9GAST|nr:hypothetical protein PoB_004821300 [Plakobranchus ocellatus]
MKALFLLSFLSTVILAAVSFLASSLFVKICQKLDFYSSTPEGGFSQFQLSSPSEIDLRSAGNVSRIWLSSERIPIVSTSAHQNTFNPYLSDFDRRY